MSQGQQPPDGNPPAPSAPPPTQTSPAVFPQTTQPQGPPPNFLASSPSTQPGAQPPAAPPTGGPPAAPAPPQQPPTGISEGIRAQLQARGYSTDTFESDDAALDYMLGAAQSLEQNIGYLQLGQQAAAAGWQPGGQQQPPQPGAPAQPESTWQWQAPEFNPAWLNQIDPATGDLRPGANPAIAQQIRDYVAWKQQQEVDFWRDPRGLIKRALDDELKRLDPQSEGFQKIVQQQVDAALDSREARRESQRILKENEKRLFQMDAAGNPRVDPRTNQMLLTSQGQVYRTYFQEALADGSSEERAARYAMRLLDADVAQGRFGPPDQQPGNGQQPPAPPTSREGFLQRALKAQQQHPGQPSATPADAEVPRSPSERPARPMTVHEMGDWVLQNVP